MNKNNWLNAVGIDNVEKYIELRFPGAEEVEILDKGDSYIVTFYTGPDLFEELSAVKLEEFTTSIDGFEFDKDWLSLVRECNEGKVIDGYKYEEHLVKALECYAFDKKLRAIKKAECDYKSDIKNINQLLNDLKIEEEVEPRSL